MAELCIQRVNQITSNVNLKNQKDAFLSIKTNTFRYIKLHHIEKNYTVEK